MSRLHIETIEHFPKEKGLPQLVPYYAVFSRGFNFYEDLVKSQIEHQNSGKKKHSLDIMTFVLTPPRNNSTTQQKDHIEISSRTDSGIQSPANSTQQSPRSQNFNPYKKEHLFCHPNYNHIFCSRHLLLDGDLSYQTQYAINSLLLQTLSNFTSAAEKGKIVHSATKLKKVKNKWL